MTVGEKLAQFWNGIDDGYDHDLFDDLWHDAYRGFSNSTRTAASKTDIKSLMEKSTGVVTYSMETLYENEEVGVEHSFVTFSDDSKQAVLGFFTFKDRKIYTAETGATDISD